MYNNTDNLEVGKDFYDLNTGEYADENGILTQGMWISSSSMC